MARAQVFDILATWIEVRDWEKAFYKVIVRFFFVVLLCLKRAELMCDMGEQPQRKFEKHAEEAGDDAYEELEDEVEGTAELQEPVDSAEAGEPRDETPREC